jgi:hypothetical protein
VADFVVSFAARTYLVDAVKVTTDTNHNMATWEEIDAVQLTSGVTPVVAVSVSPASVLEDGTTNLVYTFTRSVASASPLTVNFSVGGAAIYNTDYTQSGAASFSATAGTVTILANQTTAQVTIDPTADSTVEPDEAVVLTVTSGTGYTPGGSPATGTIANDDIALAIAALDATKPEGNTGSSPSTPFTFTVTRTGLTTGSTTVNYAGTGSGTNPANAADFVGGVLPSGTVSFAAGETSKPITINVNGDATVEPDEGFTVTLSGASGGAQITTPTATGTITNDDTSGISQWASSVIGYSSQYGPAINEAAQALGAPNVTAYGDDRRAWAPLPTNGTTEWIALGYTTPVYATGVTIRETWGNGFVTKVEVRNQSTQAFETVWSGTDPTAPGSVADFVVSFAARTYLVDAVRITVDTNHSLGTWEEIDAVQLVGT